MGRVTWPLRPLPDGRGEVWRWRLSAVAELPAARAALRGRLGGSGVGSAAGAPGRSPVDPPGNVVAEPAPGQDSPSEQLILAFDELASNALRHGESPVVATIIAGSGGWLVDVSDQAPEAMPEPAVDRDPAHGGLGLQLVARLSVAHGWYVDEGRKHVWACLPTDADARSPALV